MSVVVVGDGDERIVVVVGGVDGMIEIEAEVEREIEWSSDDDYYDDDDYCGDYPTTRLPDFHYHHHRYYSHY